MSAYDDLQRACAGALSENATSVGGLTPRWRARPADAEQAAACVRAAAAHGLALVATGAGTKLGWGSPPRRCDLLLDCSRLDALVEHSAGEFVVVAGAGLRLSALREALAGTGQHLALDPTRDGTLGGIIATGDHGPARLLHGAPRDLVIGAQMVRADGVIAASGGKVVKNVAGYDLGKLMTGSFGTLAILTRLAFRLHPVPAARRWVSTEVADPADLASLTQALLHSTVVPAAIEVERAGAGGGARGGLAVQLLGVRSGVDGCAEQARALLGDGARLDDTAPPWWAAEPSPPGDPLVKITFELSRVAETVRALDAAAHDAGVVPRLRASTGVGVGSITLEPGASQEAVVAFVAALRSRAPSYGGAVVLLDGPAAVKAALDVWGPVRGLELMRAVKDRFDPSGALAPGRFVGGI